MRKFLKQIFSFILPLTVLVVFPLCVERKRTLQISLYLFAAFIAIVAGLTIMEMTISSFIRIGKGTLALRSRLKKLVLTGLFSNVRNPMRLGVFIVVLVQGPALLSVNNLLWTTFFSIVNSIYFIIHAEPGRAKKFGDEYGQYKKHVSRWLPMATSYHPENQHKA